MKLEYTQEEIESFAKGQFSPEESAVLKQKMKENPALAEAVTEARLQLDAAWLLVKRDLKTQMQVWEKQKKRPIWVTFLNTRRTLLAAAAAVAVLAVAVYFFTRPEHDDRENVVITTPQPTDTTPTTLIERPSLDSQATSSSKTQKITLRRYAMDHFQREKEKKTKLRGAPTTSEGPSDTVQLAKKLFFEGQYDQVILLLNQIKKEHPYYLDAQVTLGDAYFKKEQFDLAEIAYEKVDDPDYADQVDWNLLLTYLAQYPQKKAEFEQMKSDRLNNEKYPAPLKKKIEELAKKVAALQ